MKLITNYGLFWRREIIAWNRSDQLIGIGYRAKRKGVVDFSKQRGVYALYDSNFRLIYVGQAGRAKRGLYPRLRSHTLNNYAERWSRFSWFGTLAVEEESDKNGIRGLVEHEAAPEERDLKTILNHLEAVAIMIGEPLLNKKGGIFGTEVRQYRQYIEKEAEYDDDVDVEDI